MDRITQKDLNILVDQINALTDSPMTPFTKTDNKLTGNVGNYHLDYGFKCVQLIRTSNDRGGVSIVSTGGNVTKQQLFRWMEAYIAGIKL